MLLHCKMLSLPTCVSNGSLLRSFWFICLLKITQNKMANQGDHTFPNDISSKTRISPSKTLSSHFSSLLSHLRMAAPKIHISWGESTNPRNKHEVWYYMIPASFFVILKANSSSSWFFSLLIIGHQSPKNNGIVGRIPSTKNNLLGHGAPSFTSMVDQGNRVQIEIWHRKTPKSIEKYTPEDGLEDDFPLPEVYSQIPAVNLPGVIRVSLMCQFMLFSRTSRRLDLLDPGRNMVNQPKWTPNKQPFSEFLNGTRSPRQCWFRNTCLIIFSPPNQH